MGTVSLNAYTIAAADPSCTAGLVPIPGADAVGDYQNSAAPFDDVGSDATQPAIG